MPNRSLSETIKSEHYSATADLASAERSIRMELNNLQTQMTHAKRYVSGEPGWLNENFSAYGHALDRYIREYKDAFSRKAFWAQFAEDQNVELTPTFD